MCVPLLLSKSQHADNQQLAIVALKNLAHEVLHLWDDIVPLLGRRFVILNEVKDPPFALLITQRRWCDTNSNCEIPRRRCDSG